MGQSGYTPPQIGGPGGGYWAPIAGGAIQNINPNGIDVVSGFFRTLINSALAALGFQDIAGGNEAYIVSTAAPDMTIHTAIPLFASSLSVAPNQIQSVTTDITSGAAVTDTQDANAREIDVNDNAGNECTLEMVPEFTLKQNNGVGVALIAINAISEINIQSNDGGGNITIAGCTPQGFKISNPGGTLFEITNTGQIQTNQNTPAPGTVTPVVYNSFITIYDTTGTAIGNIPLF